MKALVMKEAGKVTVQDVNDTAVRADHVKIRVGAVALNPTDWKHVDNMSSPGSIVGCDVAGTVTEVGSAVKASVKPGDRLSGLCHGSNYSNHADGGFAEFAQLKDGLFAHVPAGMELSQAATLGVSVTTVGQGLYQSLGLPLPTSEGTPSTSGDKIPLLIYGGSTATGTIAIQFARLSGLQILTVASKNHHEWLKKLGAEACFDYNDADCGEQIRKYTHNKLRHVFDCITEASSMAICAQALTSDESGERLYSGLLKPKDFPRADVTAKATLAYSAKGEAYVKAGNEAPAKPEDYAFAVKFWKLAETFLAKGTLVNHPVDVRSGGLDAIEQGLDDLRKGKVRGEKIVYTL